MLVRPMSFGWHGQDDLSTATHSFKEAMRLVGLDQREPVLNADKDLAFSQPVHRLLQNRRLTDQVRS